MLDEDDEIIHSFETIDNENDFLKKYQLFLKYVFNRITEDDKTQNIKPIIDDYYNTIIVNSEITELREKIKPLKGDERLKVANTLNSRIKYSNHLTTRFNKNKDIQNIKKYLISNHEDRLLKKEINIDKYSKFLYEKGNTQFITWKNEYGKLPSETISEYIIKIYTTPISPFDSPSKMGSMKMENDFLKSNTYFSTPPDGPPTLSYISTKDP